VFVRTPYPSQPTTGSSVSKRCWLGHAKLVFAVLGNVTNPWQSLVPTLLHDLEIPHLHACTHARMHARARTHTHARTHTRNNTHTQRERQTDRHRYTQTKTDTTRTPSGWMIQADKHACDSMIQGSMGEVLVRRLGLVRGLKWEGGREGGKGGGGGWRDGKGGGGEGPECQRQ
jgi:hypothetical protein